MPEQSGGRSAEQPVAPEISSAPAGTPAPQTNVAKTAQPTPAPLTSDDVAAVIAAAPGPAAPGGTPVPSSAADADVIEPEWVNKAEEVVRAHHGDPYEEEEAIEDLQQEYLKQRYGYTVGDPKQDSNKTEGT